MKLFAKAFVAVLILQIVSVSYAERGQWIFGQDPGFVTRHDGLDMNFQWNIAQGLLDISMTREAATQRVYVPLSGTYGNNDTFRLRSRVKIVRNDSASVFFGFFNSSEHNTSGTNDHVNLEFYQAVNQPGGFGGAHYDHGSTTVNVGQWYVVEMTFRALNSTYTQSVYRDDGTLLQTITPATSGLGTGVNVIGFGNWDSSQSSSYETVQFDWASWSVNDALLPDPITSKIVITETDGSTAVREKGPTSDTYMVALSSAPVADVNVNIEEISVPQQIVISPQILTFTPSNWVTPQTVTVTAIDDNIPEANPHYATIHHTASSNTAGTGYNFDAKDINVRIWDNDCPVWQPGVGLWLFDEGPNSLNIWSVVDQSGNGNHGVIWCWVC